MIIRIASRSDLPALAEVFNNSVRQIAPEKYTAEQVTAWATSASNLESFSQFIFKSTIFIAEIDGLILGFGGINRIGYLSYLYVRGDYNRRGIGSRLLTKIIEYGHQNNCDRLYTEASEFSKPLFEKFGFEIYAEEEVERNGIVFHRYLMQIHSHLVSE